MKIRMTGASGFIGFNAAQKFLTEGHFVHGIDNHNDYYDVKLKTARLEILQKYENYFFEEIDIANKANLDQVILNNNFDLILHLAAQAGVRYSITNPYAYLHSNLIGHLNILEAIRNANPRPFLIYASSSSVYGNDTIAPFSEKANARNPNSLYAATKIADEMLSQSYANMYQMEQIGLRFFTVYGPFGRPDMAYWGFSQKILNDEPIKVFNNGDLKRDFTYIDDIIEAIYKIAISKFEYSDNPHKIYNIGNNAPVKLMDFIKTLEEALGKKAILEFEPMQIGDVYETSADVTALSNDYGFVPNTKLSDGLKKFANWYKDWIK